MFVPEHGDWSFMAHGSRGIRFVVAYFVLEYYGYKVSAQFSLQTLHSVHRLLYIACRTFSFLAPPECLFSLISFQGVLHCKLV